MARCHARSLPRSRPTGERLAEARTRGTRLQPRFPAAARAWAWQAGHMLNRAELAAFLRTRRERLRPRDVGLPDGQRRRTPGLRRQEVAQLASLSVDYYIRLEQARGPRPPRPVLARALMLNGDEREYLFRIAYVAAPGSASATAFRRLAARAD